MSEMAEAGAGNYYFINTADKMASLFEKELNGLQNVAAQNTVLLIKLPPPVKLEKVFAFKYEYKEDQVMINFRDLFSEEIKGILLKFKIPDNTNSILKFISSVSYDDIHDGKRKSLSNENLLTPTKDTITYLTYFNKPVIQQALLFITNERIEQAMNEADKGNYSLARSYIQYNDLFFRRNSFYVANSKELRRMDSANYDYLRRIKNAETMNQDSIKFIQKSNRAEFYKVRNKKQ
jgi:Ca-activated chloride channel family protein